MFRSLIELEMIARDRIEDMAAREEHADQLRELKATNPSHGAVPKLTSRVRHGLGRGLIALGEHLTERPRTPPVTRSHQLSSARPR